MVALPKEELKYIKREVCFVLYFLKPFCWLLSHAAVSSICSLHPPAHPPTHAHNLPTYFMSLLN